VGCFILQIVRRVLLPLVESKSFRLRDLGRMWCSDFFSCSRAGVVEIDISRFFRTLPSRNKISIARKLCPLKLYVITCAHVHDTNDYLLLLLTPSLI